MKKTIPFLIIIVIIITFTILTITSCKKSNETSSDEIVTCPVMGTEIKASDTFDSIEYSGVTYYFCCASCKPTFEKNPEKYIGE
ncbi:YHS domain-containing protein [Candidatus Margulisiibacteriota bacterium]